MSTQDITPASTLQTLSTTYRKNQYTLWQILGIWLVGSVPTWLLGWVAFPALSAGLPLMDAGLLRMALLLAGLVWQFSLAMIILYREEGDIRLGTIGRRFWLNHPVSPRTGETKKALWWWIIPSRRLRRLHPLRMVTFHPSTFYAVFSRRTVSDDCPTNE